MILAIDIGNTNITLGIFREERLIKKAKIATREYSKYGARLKRFLANQYIEEAVISSVVPDALAKLRRSLGKVADPSTSLGMVRGMVSPSNHCRLLVAGKDIKVPIKNLYRKKSEVGQDRLVNAFAAKTLYGKPAVVIDFGTAVTFDIVSRRGEYLGGLIMPGIELSLSSLYEKTALLPKVALKDDPYIIGKDTISSMRGGILFGFGAMVDGLVGRYKDILGKDTKIIATGGNASLIKRYAKSIQIIDADLTLKGLVKI